MDKGKRIEHKESWEEALRSKLEGHTYPVPDLPPLVLPPKGRSKKTHARWLILLPAIAASVVWVLLRMSHEDTSKVLLPSENVLVAKSEPDPIAQLEVRSVTQEGSAQGARVAQTITSRTDNSPIVNTEEHAQDTPSPSVPSETTEDDEQDYPTDSATEEVVDMPKPTRPVYVPRSNQHSLGLALNVSGGGYLSASTQAQLQANAPVGLMSEVLDARSLPAREEVSYTVSERAPIESGLSLLVPLTEKLSVDAGLQYTQRRLDVRRKGAYSTSDYQMAVHLLGVPVALQYQALTWDKWSLNLQVGMSGKLPIATTVVGAKDVEERAGFVLDTFAGAGVDYKITPNIGIGVNIGGVYDVVPMNKRLFCEPISRLHLKANIGLKFWLR